MERNVIEAIEIVVQQPELEKSYFFFVCFEKEFCARFSSFWFPGFLCITRGGVKVGGIVRLV